MKQRDDLCLIPHDLSSSLFPLLREVVERPAQVLADGLGAEQVGGELEFVARLGKGTSVPRGVGEKEPDRRLASAITPGDDRRQSSSEVLFRRHGSKLSNQHSSCQASN
jgi:hypothetical protein